MEQYLLFDLDDTLFDFHKAEHIALKATLETLGVEPTEDVIALYSAINAMQWKLLELGRLDREVLKTRRFALLFEVMGSEAGADTAARLYMENLSKGHYYIEGAKELIVELSKKKEMHLFIISNGTTWIQKSRLLDASITPLFEQIFISETIGANKPSREFFEAVEKAIPNLTTENGVVIGDSLSSDIRGAVNAGYRSIWFNPKGKTNATELVPDAEIKKLSECIEALRNL